MPVWGALLALAIKSLAMAAGKELGETLAAELACKAAKGCPKALERIGALASEKQAAKAQKKQTAP